MSTLTKDGIAMREHPIQDFTCPYCYARIYQLLPEPDWVAEKWLDDLKQENDRLRAVVHRMIETIKDAIPSDSKRLIHDALNKIPAPQSLRLRWVRRSSLPFNILLQGFERDAASRSDKETRTPNGPRMLPIEERTKPIQQRAGGGGLHPHDSGCGRGQGHPGAVRRHGAATGRLGRRGFRGPRACAARGVYDRLPRDRSGHSHPADARAMDAVGAPGGRHP